ncbi:MAG: hypothetical protein ACI8PW_000373 [Methylophilaceae bacterium]|jgi:hypothetical protein
MTVKSSTFLILMPAALAAAKSIVTFAAVVFAGVVFALIVVAAFFFTAALTKPIV